MAIPCVWRNAKHITVSLRPPACKRDRRLWPHSTRHTKIEAAPRQAKAVMNSRTPNSFRHDGHELAADGLEVGGG